MKRLVDMEQQIICEWLTYGYQATHLAYKAKSLKALMDQSKLVWA